MYVSARFKQLLVRELPKNGDVPKSPFPSISRPWCHRRHDSNLQSNFRFVSRLPSAPAFDTSTRRLRRVPSIFQKTKGTHNESSHHTRARHYRFDEPGIVPSRCCACAAKSLKEQLVGTWTLVSSDGTNKDGTKNTTVVGKNPKGTLVLDARGNFSFIVAAELPKIASGDRMKTTAEENKAIAQGVFAYFGTYTVSEADKAFSLNIQGSTFSNQIGTPGKRQVMSLTENELKYNTPVTLSGGSTNWVWKRAL